MVTKRIISDAHSMTEPVSVSLDITRDAQHPVSLRAYDKKMQRPSRAAAEAPAGQEQGGDLTSTTVLDVKTHNAATLDEVLDQAAAVSLPDEGQYRQLEPSDAWPPRVPELPKSTDQPAVDSGAGAVEGEVWQEEQEQHGQQILEHGEHNTSSSFMQPSSGPQYPASTEITEEPFAMQTQQEQQQYKQQQAEEETVTPPELETKPSYTTAAAQHQPPSLTGKSCLLIASKPSALVFELTQAFLQRGATVSLALKHPQDAQLFIKNISRHMPEAADRLFNSTEVQVNMASQASIRSFASAINSSTQALDLLLLDTADSGSSGKRWYTPEGIAGEAQRNFLGPAYLLHLLQPKLAACSTAIMLTSSPLHRLGTLDDLDTMLTSWAGASTADTQLALLAYVRQLAERLKEYDVTAAAVDVGFVRESPLSGSLLRKVPPLPQLLHLLLPSAAESAKLMAEVAEGLLQSSSRIATASSRGAAAPDQSLEAENQDVEHDTAEQQYTAQQPDEQRYMTESTEGMSIPVQGERGAGTLRDEAAEVTAVQRTTAEHVESPAGVDVGETETEGRSAAFVAGELTGQAVATGEQAAQLAGQAGTETVEGAWDSTKQGTEAAGQVAKDAAEGSASFVKQGAEAVGQVGGSVAAGAIGAVKAGVQAVTQGVKGVAEEAEAVAAEGDSEGWGAKTSQTKSFRYVSRGLLATPLLTSLDHAGRATWITRLMSRITYPLYQATSSSVIYTSMLLDWPARAWLLTPAGVITSWTKRALGSRAANVLAQVQRGVPGVEGVPGGGVPKWVEVAPAGLVMNEGLGEVVWELVDTVCAQH